MSLCAIFEAMKMHSLYTIDFLFNLLLHFAGPDGSVSSAEVGVRRKKPEQPQSERGCGCQGNGEFTAGESDLLFPGYVQKGVCQMSAHQTYSFCHSNDSFRMAEIQ